MGLKPIVTRLAKRAITGYSKHINGRKLKTSAQALGFFRRIVMSLLCCGKCQHKNLRPNNSLPRWHKELHTCYWKYFWV